MVTGPGGESGFGTNWGLAMMDGEPEQSRLYVCTQGKGGMCFGCLRVQTLPPVGASNLNTS